MSHVIMYSGGIGSWMTAKRVIDQYGPEMVTLLFADVKGNEDNPYLGEDEDCYRFIRETAEKFGAELVWLNEGRNIWQVFKDDRFLGNSRLANCSKFLKQKPCREWLDKNTTPGTCTVYVGIDWTESHRLPAIEKSYYPYIAKAPLTEPPYVDKQQMLDACRGWGVEPPRMYREGWPHANCSAACVRGGQAQWRKLLEIRPDAYRFHEAKEQELRDYLGKDVSILKDRTGGRSVPLTLRAFRERQESGQESLFDDLDWGGCGCFVEESA